MYIWGRLFENRPQGGGGVQHFNYPRFDTNGPISFKIEYVVAEYVLSERKKDRTEKFDLARILEPI